MQSRDLRKLLSTNPSKANYTGVQNICGNVDENIAQSNNSDNRREINNIALQMPPHNPVFSARCTIWWEYSFHTYNSLERLGIDEYIRLYLVFAGQVLDEYTR